ncbi:hypothetical protein [Micromonospora sp. NPDC048830]|uniref:hypothetical protein n=1 Tax=Micromonospora sp. NPDC048830 TaxID=3364257 RepID=UPI00371347F4
MPAKRSSRKSRGTPPRPSPVELAPPDPDTLVVAPAAPVPPVAETPPPPRSGPSAGGARFAAARNPRAGQARRYAFRRS